MYLLKRVFNGITFERFSKRMLMSASLTRGSMFFIAICGTNKCINNILEIAFFNNNVSSYLQEIFYLHNVKFYFSNKDIAPTYIKE